VVKGLKKNDIAYQLSNEYSSLEQEGEGTRCKGKWDSFSCCDCLVMNDDRHTQNSDTRLTSDLLLCCYGILMVEITSP